MYLNSIKAIRHPEAKCAEYTTIFTLDHDAKAELRFFHGGHIAVYIDSKLAARAKCKPWVLPQIRYVLHKSLGIPAGVHTLRVLCDGEFGLELVENHRKIAAAAQTWNCRALVCIPIPESSEAWDASGESAPWVHAEEMKPDYTLDDSDAGAFHEVVVKPQRILKPVCTKVPCGLTFACHTGAGMYVCRLRFSSGIDQLVKLHTAFERYANVMISIDGVVLDNGQTHFLKAGEHTISFTGKSDPSVILEGEQLKAEGKILGRCLGTASRRFPWYTAEPFPGYDRLADMLHENWQEPDPALTPMMNRPMGNYTLFLIRQKTDGIVSGTPEDGLYAEGRDVSFIVDFGELLCGYIGYDIEAPANVTVDCVPFEELYGLDPYYCYYTNIFTRIHGGGRASIDSMERYGCRYLTVTLRNVQEPVKLSLRFTAVYGSEYNADFSCDDNRINDIFDMCSRTAQLCMFENYVDCPTWEQNFWAGDALVTAHVNLLNFGNYALDEHCINMVGHVFTDDYIALQSDARFAQKRYLSDEIPMWSFVLAWQIEMHYLYTGDLKTLAEEYAILKSNVTNALNMINERGLMSVPKSKSLFDWACNDLDMWGEVSGDNMLLAENLLVLSRLAPIVGDMVDWNVPRRALIETINRVCWDSERNAYVDTVRDERSYKGYLEFCAEEKLEPQKFKEFCAETRISEQTNTLALLCGVVPPARLEAVKAVAERSLCENFHTAAPRDRPLTNSGEIVSVGTPFFLYFTLAALYKEGKYERAFNLMRDVWGKMLDDGYATAIECFAWDRPGERYALKHPTRSSAHGWSCAPAVYLIREVLGLHPLEPGWRKFTVVPHQGKLTKLCGSVATPYGRIFVKISNGKIEVVAPPQCEYIQRV